MSKRRLFNYVEKNIALISKAPRITAHNVSPLVPEPTRPVMFGRRGKAPWGKMNNPYARELGDDGHKPPWHLWVPEQSIKNSGIHFAKLSLGKLQHKVDTGVLDPSKITMFDLVSQQIVNLPDDYTGIQLDIQGISFFEAKVNIEVSMACERTVEAIERNGGTILTRWYSKEQLSAMRDGSDSSGEVVLPPVQLVHKYLDSDLRGYMVGREHLYFRNLKKAKGILEQIREEDETSPRYNDDDHADILQERIDAFSNRAKQGLV